MPAAIIFGFYLETVQQRNNCGTPQKAGLRAPASIGSVVVVVVDCDTGKVPFSMVVVSCGMIMSPANVVGCGVVRAPSNMASVVVVVTGGVEIVVSCGIDASPLSAVARPFTPK